MTEPLSIASDSPASVLLVDDVRTNLFALEAVLEPLGLRLVRAQSGAEALARASEEDFALVLMDVQMPVLDGYETTRVLREKLSKNVPVIFVTAIHHDAEHVHRGYAAGGVDYLSKPIDPDVLKAKVRSFVDLYRRDQIIRQQETRLRESEIATKAAEAANRAKDEFLRLISHELRTPLNTIVGYAEALAADRLPPDKARAAVTTILRNARAQSAMIDDLVAFSEMVAGKLTIETTDLIDLPKIVAESVDLLRPVADAKGVTIATQLDSAIVVAGDAVRLRHIVVKLVSNAIKFSNDRGTVEVRLETANGRVRLTVRDEGAGIAPEYVSHIFDGFRQANGGYDRPYGGLGIGLALARKLVELHGGTIRVASEGASRGATFYVDLPAATDSTPKPEPATAAPLPLTGVSILLVDDDRDTLDMTAEVLECEGALVSKASSAEAAMRALVTFSADVIISDLSMPGIDGFTFLSQLRSDERVANRAPVPAIAFSAHSDEDVRQRAQAAGFGAYVAKPLAPRELCDAILRLRRVRS